jgi:hypothetical protein
MNRQTRRDARREARRAATPAVSIEEPARISFPGGPPRSGRRPGVGRRRGAAMVETAIVLPLFFLLVFGMFEMSRLGMVAQLLATAARDGCRVAVVSGRTQADVDAAVKSILDGGSIPSSACRPVMSRDITTAHLGDPITLTLQVSFKDVSWLATPIFLGSASVTTSATLSSERP